MLPIKNFITKLFYYVTAIIVGEILCRSLDIFNEYRYYYKHYNPKKCFKHILNITIFPKFGMNDRCKVFLILYFGVAVSILSINCNDFFESIIDNIPFSIIYFLLMQFIDIRYSVLNHSKWIRSNRGIDYASGMASSYFHGYLYLQLPEKGDNKQGIKERCDEYEDKHGIVFATKKLVILIPHSLHTEPILKSKLLEPAEALSTVMRNRAGVYRPFKNDVYKLTEKINNKFYYIVVEGATPLLSFFDSCNYEGTSTDEMKIMKREILVQFYKSIKKYCSKCPATKNEVDFHYYNDYDNNGNLIDIGEIIKNYIETIVKVEKKVEN